MPLLYTRSCVRSTHPARSLPSRDPGSLLGPPPARVARPSRIGVPVLRSSATTPPRSAHLGYISTVAPWQRHGAKKLHETSDIRHRAAVRFPVEAPSGRGQSCGQSRSREARNSLPTRHKPEPVQWTPPPLQAPRTFRFGAGARCRVVRRPHTQGFAKPQPLLSSQATGCSETTMPLRPDVPDFPMAPFAPDGSRAWRRGCRVSGRCGRRRGLPGRR